MATLAQRAGRSWELHHPALLGVVALAGVLWAGPYVFTHAEKAKWHLDELYTSVFTLATVFTAFLFTFYTFVITADRGFLGRAKESVYFRRTVHFTFVAIWIGAALCLATIPLLVVQPVPSPKDPWLFYVASWAGLTVWACASFVRAAYLFAIFAGHSGRG